ncbi:MAG: hypothetical protein ACYDCJ_00905 [Gammaproteobacteria bacterium]
MNAQLKPTLTPARAALAAAIGKLNSAKVADANAFAEIRSLKVVVDAESEVQQELAAIAATEQAELMTWVESGSLPTEPPLHESQRRSAEKRLRVASAKAEAARSRIQAIEAERTQLNGQHQALTADLNTCRLAALVEIAGIIGVGFKSVLAQAYLLESLLKSIENMLTAHGGDFMAAHRQWSGYPGDMRKTATDRAIDAVSKLFVELSQNPEATLPL